MRFCSCARCGPFDSPSLKKQHRYRKAKYRNGKLTVSPCAKFFAPLCRQSVDYRFHIQRHDRRSYRYSSAQVLVQVYNTNTVPWKLLESTISVSPFNLRIPRQKSPEKG